MAQEVVIVQITHCFILTYKEIASLKCILSVIFCKGEGQKNLHFHRMTLSLFAFHIISVMYHGCVHDAQGCMCRSE